MKFKQFHLTYCLNIYPAESWIEIFTVIKNHCLKVKKNCSNDYFALGLRLSARACQELTKKHSLLEEFLLWLKQNSCYVFTINIFPYGQFHKKIVKKNVYFPDWSQGERVDYTLQAIKILAFLLPEGMEGSLSTVPITYGKKEGKDSLKNLSLCGSYLERIYQKTEKKIVLALEPEPDCYLETTKETVNFFMKFYQAYPNLKAFVGICFDTCHIALQFEDLCQSLKILHKSQVNIAKIQLSSALVLDTQVVDPHKALQPFNEKIYLHQTKIKSGGKIYSFSDLPEALDSSLKGEWRIHFHLPLYLKKTSLKVSSTQNLLNQEFFELLRKICPYLEIETYTFDVFPECEMAVDESVIKEFDFVKNQLINLS